MYSDIIEAKVCKGGVGVFPKHPRPSPPIAQGTRSTANNIRSLKFPSDDELHAFIISRDFLCYDAVACGVRDYIACKLQADV